MTEISTYLPFISLVNFPTDLYLASIFKHVSNFACSRLRFFHHKSDDIFVQCNYDVPKVHSFLFLCIEPYPWRPSPLQIKSTEGFAKTKQTAINCVQFKGMLFKESIYLATKRWTFQDNTFATAQNWLFPKLALSKQKIVVFSKCYYKLVHCKQLYKSHKMVLSYLLWLTTFMAWQNIFVMTATPIYYTSREYLLICSYLSHETFLHQRFWKNSIKSLATFPLLRFRMIF